MRASLAPVTLAAAVLVAGCAMLDSTLTHVISATDRIACASSAGVYFLPKTYFRVSVARVWSGEDNWYELDNLVAVRKSDGDKPYCLDYLASPTADEEINIVKYSQNLNYVQAYIADKKKLPTDTQIAAEGTAALQLKEQGLLPDHNLLRYVASDAIDQSAYILKTLIRTLFLGIAGDAGLSSRSKAAGYRVREKDRQIVAQLEYDPFDPTQTALINNTLKDFGFCLIVEAGTFDPAYMSVDHYCDNPKSFVQHRPDFVDQLRFAREHTEVEASRGILYRPRIPYSVYVFIKSDFGRSGSWKLRKMTTEQMENIAPIVSVGIDRTFFAQRKTALVFDQGTLTNICIFKTSELQNFVEVPLEVVKSVVSLPTTILQIRINLTNNEKTLVDAEEQLIRAQQEQINYQKKSATPLPAEVLATDFAQLPDAADVANSFFKKDVEADFTALCPTPVGKS